MLQARRAVDVRNALSGMISWCRDNRGREQTMSTLTLVRHGQATPFDKITDRLSEIGEEQARHLARYWLLYNISFDEAYSGTLVRQQRTAEIVAEVFRAEGLKFPKVEPTADFNEYDADGILKKLAPALAEKDAQFKKLTEEY